MAVRAMSVADWYLANVPEDGVCYWDFDDPVMAMTGCFTDMIAPSGMPGRCGTASAC